jgi:COP9 signalosome complex subunit 12
LNSIGLSKNVLRALGAAGDDIPPLKLFPKSHVVTFKYYRGVIAFLEESYTEVSHSYAPWIKYVYVSHVYPLPSRQKNI